MTTTATNVHALDDHEIRDLFQWATDPKTVASLHDEFGDANLFPPTAPVLLETRGGLDSMPWSLHDLVLYRVNEYMVARYTYHKVCHIRSVLMAVMEKNAMIMREWNPEIDWQKPRELYRSLPIGWWANISTNEYGVVFIHGSRKGWLDEMVARIDETLGRKEVRYVATMNRLLPDNPAAEPKAIEKFLNACPRDELGRFMERPENQYPF